MQTLYFFCLAVFEFARGDLGLPWFRPPVVANIPAVNISSDDIKEAFSCAQVLLKKKIDIENKYLAEGNNIPATELSMDIRVIGLVDPKTVQMNNIQVQYEEASKWLSREYGLTQDETSLGLQTITLPDEVPAVQQCKRFKEVLSCDEKSKYRTPDGSCNNLLNSPLGGAFSCYNIMSKLFYTDGLSSPRRSVDRSDLPNPRHVSRMIVDDVFILTKTTTQMIPSFGHFLSHDVTLIISSLAGDSGAYINCCPNHSSTAKLPSMCFPISVPKDDPDFSQDHRTCISLVRAAACNENCKLGTPRRQVNQQSSFIDASHVYGLSESETKVLRTGKGGALKNQYYSSDEFPMASLHPDVDQCSKAMEDNEKCIQTGDYRAIQQPGLTAMHIIYFREHNRIAKIISSNYPDLSDEAVFQETRRIIVALIQVVTYKEFLPTLIGPDLMSFFKLNILKDCFSKYNSSVDPRVLNEYSKAAARFGHTMVPRWYKEMDKDGAEEGEMDIVDNLFRMPCFYKGKMDSITRGLYWQRPEAYDRHFIAAMSNGGMPAPGKRDGLDHAAYNVQRGRETGLPSYADVLEFCYNVSIKTFKDLNVVMTSETIRKFQDVYSNVKDIDLYVGGLAEIPIENSVVGPTYGCITGLQYHALKFGDRFYFEHGSQTGSFTKGQLKELRRVTLAGTICQNSKVGKISPNVFRVVSDENAVLDCKAVPHLDVKNWLNR